eukprot:TRINITY_DN5301_c0_g1_i5.p1 TRINITY_DN5301_c0_g1~~TRINITY_DN5301_c0_g1_i5.p1  ORF type:complete len:312 (+),score=45.34 TRINITY_DN5301_c0_g1_i5:42-938(+)
MAREVRRVRLGACEIKTFTISRDLEDEEEITLSADEQQALDEWMQQRRQEKEEDRGLTPRQHALIALGRAAKCRACVEVYMQEPSLPQLVERTLSKVVPMGGRQLAPVPPADRPRRPAPKARQWNTTVEKEPRAPHLPDVDGTAQRVRRPAPKARQQSASSDNVVTQTAEAEPAISSADATFTDRLEVGQDRSGDLPTVGVARDAAPHLLDVDAAPQRVRRPAPKARQRSDSSDNVVTQTAEAEPSSDNVVTQTAEAEPAISSADATFTDRLEVGQDRSGDLPTVGVARDAAHASLPL